MSPALTMNPAGQARRPGSGLVRPFSSDKAWPLPGGCRCFVPVLRIHAFQLMPTRLQFSTTFIGSVRCLRHPPSGVYFTKQPRGCKCFNRPPKPRFLFPLAWLPERPKQVTLIGAFRCAGGVVLLADRQETIPDYAKWDVNKIAHYELANQYRFLMAGTGDSDTIEMVKTEVVEEWRKTLSTANVDVKKMIIQTVARVTKDCILPIPRDERPYVDLIWAIQQMHGSGPPSIELFRTYRLNVLPVVDYYFAGSPVLLVRYLADQYLKHVLMTTEEAEALGAYMLWEAKEYDPYVGKHSDIVTLKEDGTLGRLDRFSEKYWEEHFAHLKKALQLLPLLSCSSSTITKQTYPAKDHLQRFKAALDTLIKAQAKMRVKAKPERTKLEAALNKNLRKAALKFLDQENAKAKRLNAQTSTGQQ